MASQSLRSFYPEEETSTLLDRTPENNDDYQVLRSLTFLRLETEDPVALAEIEAEIELLLARYRPA